MTQKQGYDAGFVDVPAPEGFDPGMRPLTASDFIPEILTFIMIVAYIIWSKVNG